jgi:hypothetical protein
MRGVGRDPGIANILAWKITEDRDLGRQKRRKILGRMRGEVDLSRRQGDVELLGEKPLAAGLAERSVGDEIAARLDDDGLDPATGRAMRGGEAGCDLARLGERERASSRAEPRG